MPEQRDRSAASENPDAPKLKNIAAEIERAFPLTARRTELVLFDVDPDHLQVQWQIEPGHLEQVRGAFPARASDVRPQLRLLRLDAPGNRRQAAFLFPVIEGGASGSEGVARFDVTEYGATYQAELGFVNGDGGWLLLARSNPVQLPRPVGSPAMSPTDMQDDSTRESAQHAMGETGAASRPDAGQAPRSEQLTGEGTPVAGPPPPFDPTLAQSGTPLAPVYPNPLPRLDWVPDSDFPRVIGVLESPPPAVAAIPLPVSSRPVAHELPQASPVPRVPLRSSIDLPPSVLPSSRHSDHEEGAWPVFPPFDPRDSVSSSILRAEETTRSGIELHAELLVYGRAAPGSQIRVFGQNLRVPDNGRFFMRRVLDDTTQIEIVSQASPAKDSAGSDAE